MNSIDIQNGLLIDLSVHLTAAYLLYSISLIIYIFYKIYGYQFMDLSFLLRQKPLKICRVFSRTFIENSPHDAAYPFLYMQKINGNNISGVRTFIFFTKISQVLLLYSPLFDVFRTPYHAWT